MFEVKITGDAKRIIERAVAEREGPKVALRIHRQGPVGDVVRGPIGEAEWKIERRHPFAADVGSYSSIPELDADIIVVDGIKVWLALIPRPGERGVIVTVREEELHVDAIDG
jgi:hypothetical protein